MERPGDFRRLLAREGVPLVRPTEGAPAHAPGVNDTQGTTVIALRYDSGILNLGDRRATAENVVMYDLADKIIPLDDYTLLAISGSYARAMEVVRFLQHAFKYYRRTQLQEMSVEGKVNEVARAIAANLPNALQGIGAFLPLLSVYDHRAEEGRIFFYDGMGARFESADYGAAGSGSHRIRGIFDYITKTRGSFREMSLDQVLKEAMVLLDIAASLDAFTAGYEKTPPLAKTVSAEGVTVIPEEKIRKVLAGLSK